MATFCKGNGLLWPNDRVPYEIDDGDFPADSGGRADVEWAIDHWNGRSHVKFVAHTVGSRENWVLFVKHATACSSKVGRQPLFTPFGNPPAQEIRCQLDAGGFPRGSVVHEMGHAVGLFHEHQRPDRDDYVTVSGGDDTNFGKKSSSEVILLGPYDYLSIMHYPRSPNLSAPSRYTVGQRVRLSYLDVYGIDTRYEAGGGDHWLLSAIHVARA